jgi:hypothetical protein
MLGMNDRRTMPRREFTSQKALQAHAEQTVCILEGIAIRQRRLSPDQYEIVDVRTSRGVLRSALLIPKAVLKALWEAEAPFREALGIKREFKQLRTKRTAK